MWWLFDCCYGGYWWIFNEAVDDEHSTKRRSQALYIIMLMFRPFTNYDTYTPNGAEDVGVFGHEMFQSSALSPIYKVQPITVLQTISRPLDDVAEGY